MRYRRRRIPSAQTALSRLPPAPQATATGPLCPRCLLREGDRMGSVIKKRRKRMAKKKHRKLLKRTRVARRNKK
ncbi:hypothetical protein GCM10027440_17630 [Nocardiopsis coralliicola]